MTIHLEIEEGFGRAWHRFITRRASPEFEEAAVALEEVRRSLLLLFRGTGGEAGVGVEAASARELLVRRSLLQQVAGTCQQLPVAWFDADSLRLPAQLAVFPDAELNRELYRWLALLAAHSQPMCHWARDNQAWTRTVLERYPLLRPRYQRMVNALLSLRPDPGTLPPAEAELELALQQALRDPGSIERLPRSEKAPWPVPLWLYPPQRLAAPQRTDLIEGDEQGRSAHSEAKGLARKRAERVEQDPGRGGLLLFRLENLFSWSEHIELDRAGDDSEDLDAAKVADDLDHLSLSRQRQKKGGGLKLDLDLPAADFDDVPLGEGIRLPEWDYRRQQLIEDHVCLQPMLPRDAVPAPLPDALAPIARRLRRQFESLRQQPQWLRRQPQGAELDLEAWLDFSVERRLGACSEPGLFLERRQTRRDLACLLLADLSMSTDAHIDNDHRVIDLISDSLLLFGEALQAVGDRFALYGFSSLRRHQVRLTQLKTFDERHNDTVRGRIRALRPGYYTRMGAAIRRATQLLLECKERQRVLLILTDGKPNDLDLYEGRYGVEDTRQAVLDARRAGLVPFCITIDREAADYLPHLFGSQGYLLINDPAQLPVQLPQLYRQLTRRQG